MVNYLYKSKKRIWNDRKTCSRINGRQNNEGATIKKKEDTYKMAEDKQSIWHNIDVI